MDARRRGPSSPDRSAPSLLLLPVAILVGAVVGLATLDEHQDAVRPEIPTAAAHSASVSEPQHHDGVHAAMSYLGSLARRVHL